MESGDWNCGCGEVNFKRRNSCRKCNKRKINASVNIRPNDWRCSNDNCGEINFASRNSCRKCGVIKNGSMSQPINIIQKPGDWICTNDDCSELNFASRNICRKCNSPKNNINMNTNVNTIVNTNTNTNTSQFQTENVCVVCLENTKTHAIIKCGHLCYCGLCGYNINKCPICRETYNPDTDLLKIYTA